MDVVITYVDGLDPVWRQSYESCLGKVVLEKRYRDWGTLKYLLRGIEECMPFIDNVFLVVSSASQVPAWASEHLRVVLHSDIIPAEFLPVFNSTAIEMFLHRIPGLSEEYIYFNDDFFPLNPMTAEDFFSDGKIRLNFSPHRHVSNQYMRHVCNSDALARKALGLGPSGTFMRPQHSCAPMLRSESEKLFSAVESEILSSVTRTREDCNVNQYLFQDYLYYKGLALRRQFGTGHISLAVGPLCRIKWLVRHSSAKIMCINDVQMSQRRFERYRAGLLSAFDAKFPKPSRFELRGH